MGRHRRRICLQRIGKKVETVISTLAKPKWKFGAVASVWSLLNHLRRDWLQ